MNCVLSVDPGTAEGSCIGVVICLAEEYVFFSVSAFVKQGKQHSFSNQAVFFLFVAAGQ